MILSCQLGHVICVRKWNAFKCSPQLTIMLMPAAARYNTSSRILIDFCNPKCNKPTSRVSIKTVAVTTAQESLHSRQSCPLTAEKAPGLHWPQAMPLRPCGQPPASPPSCTPTQCSSSLLRTARDFRQACRLRARHRCGNVDHQQCDGCAQR